MAVKTYTGTNVPSDHNLLLAVMRLLHGKNVSCAQDLPEYHSYSYIQKILEENISTTQFGLRIGFGTREDLFRI